MSTTDIKHRQTGRKWHNSIQGFSNGINYVGNAKVLTCRIRAVPLPSTWIIVMVELDCHLCIKTHVVQETVSTLTKRKEPTTLDHMKPIAKVTTAEIWFTCDNYHVVYKYKIQWKIRHVHIFRRKERDSSQLRGKVSPRFYWYTVSRTLRIHR